MIVSFSKKHAKGSEKPVGKLTAAPEASIVRHDGMAKTFVYFRHSETGVWLATLSYSLPELCGEYPTKSFGYKEFYLESPGAVVSLTQL